jgi:hypothetical protein
MSMHVEGVQLSFPLVRAQRNGSNQAEFGNALQLTAALYACCLCPLLCFRWWRNQQQTPLNSFELVNDV